LHYSGGSLRSPPAKLPAPFQAALAVNAVWLRCGGVSKKA